MQTDVTINEHNDRNDWELRLGRSVFHRFQSNMINMRGRFGGIFRHPRMNPVACNRFDGDVDYDFEDVRVNWGHSHGRNMSRMHPFFGDPYEDDEDFAFDPCSYESPLAYGEVIHRKVEKMMQLRDAVEEGTIKPCFKKAGEHAWKLCMIEDMLEDTSTELVVAEDLDDGANKILATYPVQHPALTREMVETHIPGKFMVGPEMLHHVENVDALKAILGEVGTVTVDAVCFDRIMEQIGYQGCNPLKPLRELGISWDDDLPYEALQTHGPYFEGYQLRLASDEDKAEWAKEAEEQRQRELDRQKEREEYARQAEARQAEARLAEARQAEARQREAEEAKAAAPVETRPTSYVASTARDDYSWCLEAPIVALNHELSQALRVPVYSHTATVDASLAQLNSYIGLLNKINGKNSHRRLQAFQDFLKIWCSEAYQTFFRKWLKRKQGSLKRATNEKTIELAGCAARVAAWLDEEAKASKPRQLVEAEQFIEVALDTPPLATDSGEQS